jgi:ceramide glucosyltransferase
VKTFLLLCSLIVCSSLGEILSAKGMQKVGAISFQPRALLGAIWRMVRNPFLIAGVCFLAVSFFSFISLLSYADLSFVVPLTAVAYITNTLGGRYFLGERISMERWLGTLLVAIGVALIALADKLENWFAQHAAGLAQQIFALLAPTEIFNQLAAPWAFWALFCVRLCLLVLVLAACVYYVIALLAGLSWLAERRQPRALGRHFSPAVTILKPVRGAEAQAYENFASFCRQDYPVYQILFGVQDARDPVIPILEQLQRDFPASDIKLIISTAEIGHNRKVSNLQNMLGHAQHDVLVIADSDIRVGPDYLRCVVAPLAAERVGMVTCLYRGTHAPTFAGLLENLGLSATFGPEVCAARWLQGVKFALGSTIVMKRGVLAEIGGFAAVADYLADDYQLGQRTAAAGYTIHLADYVVEHVSEPLTWRAMWHHQLRWARAVHSSRPWGYRGLIFTYGTTTALLGLLAWQFGAFAWGLLALTLVLRGLPAVVVGVLGMRDYQLIRWFWLVPVRDLLTFGVWLASFAGKRIHWRGQDYRLLPGGKLAPDQD